MIGKLLEMWRDDLWHEVAAATLRVNPQHLPRDIGDVRTRVERERNSKVARQIDREVERELERELLDRGDMGFLEFLAHWAPASLVDAPRRKARGRTRVVRQLADDLLSRRLYKLIGQQAQVGPGAQKLYEQYKDPTRRRELERRAARFAGLAHSWHVLVWLPEPGMRLKVAEVLVDDGGAVGRFVDRERGRGGRGADIYDSHRHLWAVSVFVHPTLDRHVRADREQIDAVLAFVAAELDVRFDELVPSLGPSTGQWKERLAATRALKVEERGDDALIVDLMRRARTGVPRRRRRTRDETLADMLPVFRAAAVEARGARHAARSRPRR
jgi:hypothetical protein